MQTGTYTVIVRSFQGAGTGSYSLYLALSPGANEHGVIQNGGSVDESISADGEIDSFTFEGTAGQRGVISISGNVVGGDYYYVFNPDGSSLTEAGGAARINLVQTGTYTVIVRSFQGAGTGSYSLHLALSPGANEHGVIQNGGSVAESISADGEIDSFTFEGTAGQRGVISISGNVVGGDYYYVFNPDGSNLTEAGSAARINLGQTGTYTVLVRSFQATGTGNYEVYLALAPGANEHGALPFGTATSQVIDADGEIDSFSFVGSANTSGSLSMASNIFSGGVFHVFNPDGSELAIGTSARALNLSLTQSGVYTVITRSFQAAGTGSYELLLDLPPPACTAADSPSVTVPSTLSQVVQSASIPGLADLQLESDLSQAFNSQSNQCTVQAQLSAGLRLSFLRSGDIIPVDFDGAVQRSLNCTYEAVCETPPVARCDASTECCTNSAAGRIDIGADLGLRLNFSIFETILQMTGQAQGRVDVSVVGAAASAPTGCIAGGCESISTELSVSGPGSVVMCTPYYQRVYQCSRCSEQGPGRCCDCLNPPPGGSVQARARGLTRQNNGQTCASSTDTCGCIELDVEITAGPFNFTNYQPKWCAGGNDRGCIQ